MSGKGGVGKTTTCLGTALALLAQGHHPAILDIDVENPSLGIACGLSRDDLVFQGEFITPPKWHGIPIMSLSLMPLNEFRYTPTLVDEERKHFIIQQLFKEVDWGDTDFLIIDTPPGSGEEVRGLMKLEPDGIIIVTSPQELSEAAARRVVLMAQEYNLRILGLLQNDVNGAEGTAGRNVAEAYNLGLIASIEWTPGISVSMEAHETFDHAPFDMVASVIIQALSTEPLVDVFQEMTDAQWENVQTVLPQQVAGRARADDRAIINGILYVTRTMGPWAHMPAFYGAWKTAWNRHDAWSKSGVWSNIEAALQPGWQQVSDQTQEEEGSNSDEQSDGATGQTGTEREFPEGSEAGERAGLGIEDSGEVPGRSPALSSASHSEAEPGSSADS